MSKYEKVLKILKNNEFFPYDSNKQLICYNEPEGIIQSFNLSDIKEMYESELKINYDNPSEKDLEKFIEASNGELSDGFNFDYMKNTKENLKKLINKYADEIIEIYEDEEDW